MGEKEHCMVLCEFGSVTYVLEAFGGTICERMCIQSFFIFFLAMGPHKAFFGLFSPLNARFHHNSMIPFLSFVVM